METLIACVAAAALAFAAAFFVVLCLLLKKKNEAQRDAGEILRLRTELDKAREIAAANEANMGERLRDKEKACDELLRAKDEANAMVLAEKDKVCEAVVKAKEKACAEKEASLTAAMEAMKDKFSNIALQQMKAGSEGLSKANRTNMDALLGPVRDQVKLLQELAEKTRRETQSLGVSMAKDVLDMGNIAKNLQNVATALTSNTRFQGRKGEEILAEKLRQAGLEENVNFFLQRGTEADRPDAQVRDTENRWLIIDSKVSLTAYMEYVDAKDEATKAEKLALHVLNVRQKIDQLARKKYPKVFSEENKDRNYLPITAMFVPYEAPLMEALKAEPSLWQRAAENNVVLITPLTLLAYLRLVYLAWQHEKESRNQAEIVDTARELLNRTNSFLKTFEDVGAALDSLADKYEKAKSVLVDAPRAQTIANSARKLIDLHVRLENRKGRKPEQAACLKSPEDSPGDSSPVAVNGII